MGLLWESGATKYQKIVAGILGAITIGPLFLMFTHNFIVEPRILEFSSYVSVVLTVCSVSIMAYLYAKELWKPASAWYKQSKFTRALVILFTPLFIFGMLWVNLVISAPQLYTVLFGSETVRWDVVVKNRYYSKRSCSYRLEPKSINAFYFYYCISESLYNLLPETEIESELLIKQSALGYVVEDIRLLSEKR